METQPSRPPRWLDKLLTRLVAPHLREEVLGDLHERYTLRVQRLGQTRARRDYWREVLAYMRPRFIIRKPSEFSEPTTTVMLRNYVKIAWRNLVKHKGYSFINIFGLATGMTVAILIGLWVWDEFNFNKSFQNYERIAQIYQNRNFDGKIGTFNTVPHPMAKELRNTYPDFETTSMADKHDHIVALGEKKLTVSGLFVEPSFTKIFTLVMKVGHGDNLKDINTILISSSMAKNLFGNEKAMGKTVKLDNKINMAVVGVFNDFPKNSDFADIKILAPWAAYISIDQAVKNTQNHWGSNDWLCYVLLRKGYDLSQTNAKIKSLLYNRVDQDEKTTQPELIIHPLEKWHLYETFTNGKNTGGLIQLLRLFTLIGFFVVVLACINFMNLSTARSENRAKEIGIRKVVGSDRRQIIMQFLSESMLVVLLSFLVASLFIFITLPAFNAFTNKQIRLPLVNSNFLIVSLLFTIITGLLAGSYPSLYLSSFQPIKVLKGQLQVGKMATIPRKTLVVIQFTISIALIIGTVVVFQQIQFVKNRLIGYNNNGLIYLPISTPTLKNLDYKVLRSELLKTNVVENVSETSAAITARGNLNIGYKWNGDETKTNVVFNELRGTFNNGATLGFQFLEGRDFSETFASDSSAVIVNEFAANLIGRKNLMGKTIRNGNVGEFHVIGVIKNIVDDSPYADAIPSVYFLNEKNLTTVNIRIKPTASTNGALTKIGEVLKKLDPAAPFDFKFAENEMARKYMGEELIGKLAFLFALFAILISCLGLFGLASFVAEQRTKEIAVRKVLGATVTNLWQLLSKEFVVLVIISCVIAAPIAYYFMNEWLQKYTYRTEISWWIFIVSAAGALIITLLTVSFQSIKAALMNPVKSLRSE